MAAQEKSGNKDNQVAPLMAPKIVGTYSDYFEKRASWSISKYRCAGSPRGSR
jgi:hypothetical protein